MIILSKVTEKIGEILDIASKMHVTPMGTFRTITNYMHYCNDLGLVGSGFESHRLVTKNSNQISLNVASEKTHDVRCGALDIVETQ